jgi:aspartyl-tRNA(Asn)/glutamyl-tRNA(Gln) amidotransferase subunit A
LTCRSAKWDNKASLFEFIEEKELRLELFRLGLSEARELLDKKEVSPKELLESVLGRVEDVEKRIRAYVTVTEEKAREMASSGAAGPLSGIPIAVKDNMCTKGITTTCSSRILEDFIPPYESTVTKRMTDAGYVLVGKTNLDEFAMGSSTENSGFSPTHNPWDPERVPGGSSGGSAAAVSADECIAAIGSDTGGSIRQPASLCGVVGLKPTYGRVSRFGLIAFASSLDQIGPLTKTVRDSAILMNVIAGHDPKDSTSAPVEMPDFTAPLGREIKGLKVGVPREFFIEGMDPEVEKAVREAIKNLESQGAVPVEVSVPNSPYAIAAYYIIANCEASSNLARYDGVKYGLRAEGKDLIDMYMQTRSEGFGPEVKRRIMLGTYALSSGYYDAYYLKAQKVRTLIKRDFEEVFRNVDVIATPTTPEVAFKAGEKTDEPLKMYLSDIFTNSINLAGVPAISVPCGFSSQGLPIGLQLIGKYFDEESILQVAHSYEQSTEWHRRRPAL